jgi:hypothetical protein
MRCGPGSRFENISFSNLVMNGVTGPISIGLGPHTRRRPPADAAVTSTSAPPETEPPAAPEAPGIVRNISFSGIHATVVKPVPLPDAPFASTYNPGEIFSCITLNTFDDGVLENISFNDVHILFPGGGTAEQAAVRDVPKIAGEYYEIGVPPAHALFARKVRGLTLQNVRFTVAAPDLRPAMVFDQVTDAIVNGCSVQGNRETESALRFIGTRDVLLTALRVLTPASVFLQLEGVDNTGIAICGSDLSNAAKPLAFTKGARKKAVKLRI